MVVLVESLSYARLSGANVKAIAYTDYVVCSLLASFVGERR
jgi:ribose/xylose/arabinose/galactoside ABC-type transport system permease subunit